MDGGSATTYLKMPILCKPYFAGEVYSSNETAGTITIASMTVTTIFGCRGRNEAGLGPLVQSYIGVIPRGK